MKIETFFKENLRKQIILCNHMLTYEKEIVKNFWDLKFAIRNIRKILTFIINIV